jgi:hypothetical protein
VNLGTGRLIVIIALVAAGVVVLSQGFSDEATTSANPSTTPSVTPSGTAPTGPTGSESPGGGETPEPRTTGVPFIALNGTETTGAGAAAQDLLVGDGYESVLDAADSPVQGVSVTTIYYRGGSGAAQNLADADFVNLTYFEGKGQVDKLSAAPVFEEVVPKSATLVIVVGADFADALVAG